MLLGKFPVSLGYFSLFFLHFENHDGPPWYFIKMKNWGKKFNEKFIKNINW